jgi:cysteine-rich repeat protein
VQGGEGAAEQCYNGTNTDVYDLTGTGGGCAPGCVIPPRCGDAVVQNDKGETCDDGINDGSYNGCTATCQRGPWCGDAITDSTLINPATQLPFEVCDDGVNDGTYNACGVGCTTPLVCGDNILTDPEGCDDGNLIPGDGCSANCQVDGCGDGIPNTAINPDNGLPYEACDDGINDGGYGECAPDCLWGPRCGDAFTQTEFGETCDDGINDNSYGGCTPNCQIGPHCGDGQVALGYEECDKGPEGTDKLCVNCKEVHISIQ